MGTGQVWVREGQKMSGGPPWGLTRGQSYSQQMALTPGRQTQSELHPEGWLWSLGRGPQLPGERGWRPPERME